MDTLPQEWGALLALVFVLGMKHGFDADHLATIDGLTRHNLPERPALARYCGTLFSLGHGLVVMGVALAASVAAAAWQVPPWFATLGAITSILILLGLGAMNMVAVARAAPDELVRPVGWRSGVLGRVFGRFQRTGSPLGVALVGALFALSFDTMSQAALFALTAGQFGGWQHALVLGSLFTLGMLLTDALNGFWIARLLRRADETARVASRVMSLVVAGVSLLVATLGISKLVSPAIATWSDGKEILLGVALLGVVAIGFLCALVLARRTLAA